MKKWLFCIAMVVLLSGCTNSIHGNSVIDWVDFVKVNGHTYTGVQGSVIKDPNEVTDKVVDEVKFKVGGVVTNPNYRTKAGDAAFLEIGTKLYEVKGFKPDELIAAKDETMIGGYRLYAEDEFMKTMIHTLDDLPTDKVKQISLYYDNEVKPYKTLSDEDKDKFIQFLESARDTQAPEGYPTYYNMVFFTDEPIANIFSLSDDGKDIYYYSWGTKILDREFRELIK